MPKSAPSDNKANRCVMLDIEINLIDPLWVVRIAQSENNLLHNKTYFSSSSFLVQRRVHGFESSETDGSHPKANLFSPL